MDSLSLFVSESPPLESPIFPVAPGVVIGGKYRITRRIASGGMGVVFEAEHLLLEARVAIKVVRPEVATDEVIDRFCQEAKVAARLRSPHIARVLDTGRLDSGMPYLVMEYLEGEDLCERLHRVGRLRIPQAVDYVLQACEALAEAHAAGLVHRDLKPENLFVSAAPDGDEVVKILDFGITKLPARVGGRSYTQPGSSVGSPHYMAPEQMNSPHDVDARADIWTLGVVLYELLGGCCPFEGDSIPTVCARVLSATPMRLRNLRPDVPLALERAISSCLQKDRRARYADVFELARAIAPFGAPGAGQRLERIRRIAGVEVMAAELELERISEIPVQLTRRRSVPVPASKRSARIFGAALASIAVVALATATTARDWILDAHALAPSPSAAGAPIASRNLPAPASGVRTGALARALPELQKPKKERPTFRHSPRAKPAKRLGPASAEARTTDSSAASPDGFRPSGP